jgi:hypothetical protein
MEYLRGMNMTIIVTYQVDAELYNNPATPHRISMTTTEHICGNDVLAPLQFGKDFAARINDAVLSNFSKSKKLPKEQFFAKKTYSRDNSTVITRSTFERKLKQFGKDETFMTQEILVEHQIEDKSGPSSVVQIVVKVKNDTMTAIVDFKDVEQHKNFIAPAWLIPPTEDNHN